MSFRKKGRSRRAGVELNLTPLIDIVFNLLIFFLITSTFVQNPGIEVVLPTANQGDEQSEDAPLILGVLDDGRYVYQGTVMGEDEVRDLLKTQREADPSIGIFIQADAKSTIQKAITVINIAKELGYEAVNFATQPE